MQFDTNIVVLNSKVTFMTPLNQINWMWSILYPSILHINPSTYTTELNAIITSLT